MMQSPEFKKAKRAATVGKVIPLKMHKSAVSCCFVLWSVWVYFGIVWVSRGINLGHVGVSLESVCSLSASVGCLFSIYDCSRSQSPGEAFVWMDDTEDIQHPCIPPHLDKNGGLARKTRHDMRAQLDKLCKIIPGMHKAHQNSPRHCGSSSV